MEIGSKKVSFLDLICKQDSKLCHLPCEIRPNGVSNFEIKITKIPDAESASRLPLHLTLYSVPGCRATYLHHQSQLRLRRAAVKIRQIVRQLAFE
jgi:hypothetical protein